MKNCTGLYKTKKMQSKLKNTFQQWSKKTIQEQGGLPANAWLDFKKGFKRGFMRSCKAMKSKSRKNSKNR